MRYHFEIGNEGTEHRLWVGSKCIQRFDIAGFAWVKVDLARLIREAEDRKIRELLFEVAERTDGRVNLLRLWAHRGGLLPREALRLAKACYRLNIEPEAFPKLRRQRASDRAELARMTEWERELVERWLKP